MVNQLEESQTPKEEHIKISLGRHKEKGNLPYPMTIFLVKLNR